MRERGRERKRERERERGGECGGTETKRKDPVLYPKYKKILRLIPGRNRVSTISKVQEDTKAYPDKRRVLQW